MNKQSAPRLAQIRLLILASTALVLTGCAGAQVQLVQASACSTLVGPTLRADVGSVDPPGETATAGDLWVAFDGQTSRLDTSNTYRQAVLEIVERCEARDQVAARQITHRPWWRIFG